LHRLAAVLGYIDSQPKWATVGELAEIRRLLIGDLERPQYVAVPVAELEWLRGVRLAAEVVALAMDPEHRLGAVAGLRNQLDREPKAGAR